MMTSSHLSDESLQAFLFNEIQDDTIAKHLALCSMCRKRLEAYRHLSAEISKMPPEAFPFDLTTLTMPHIMRYEKQKSRRQAMVFWGILIWLLMIISAFSIPYIPKILAIFNSKSIFTTLLVIGTGAVVFLFLLADLALQYKTKAGKIFQNNLQPAP